MEIETRIQAKQKDLGDDFIVRRALPTVQRRTVGPFVFFDHMGPVDLQIGHGMDVRPHPHIGLSTLTYLFEGEVVHRDTLGFEQTIQPGAVNWMTAGRGIAHSERSARDARSTFRRLHGIQMWLALPKEHEEVAPSFHHHSAGTIPEISVQGAKVRVIAGEYTGEKSPVSVYSPTTYFEVSLDKGANFSFSRPGHELAVYVAIGHVVGGSQRLNEGELAVVKATSEIQLRAELPSRVLVLGGQALPEPRHIWWNFVSSSKERIEQAKKDWTEQKFGQIRGETEFIPLPP